MATPLEALESSSLLVGLSSEEIESLLAISEQRAYSAPDLIVAEGTPSDCLFILRDGSVVIEKENAGNPVALATFAEMGEFFGEMSLIDIMPRSANIRAEKDVEVLSFPKKALVYSIGQCNILPTNLIIGDVAHGSNGTTRIVRVTEVGGMASMEERPVA